MKYRKINQLCRVGSVLFVCLSCNSPFVDTYSGLKESIAEENKSAGRLLGRTGDVKVTEAGFAYADDQRVVRAEQLEGLAEGVRRLYIKKYLLRQLAVARGLDEGVFDSPEAAAFLVPRLEKAMEEYYYRHAGGFEAIEARVKQELRPDDGALERFTRNNPAVRKAGLNRGDVEAETDRILGRVAELRVSRERQKIIERLIKENPPMEIHP